MMKRLIFAVFFAFVSICISAQTVSNVMAVQEGNNIVVSFDIDKPSPAVQLTVSTDGGRTFSSPLKKVSGDVSNVQPGCRKIIWEVLSERESLTGDNIVFNVVVCSDHQWVDLGLSVKWATCNVGASAPEDYGDYFAWGETTPKSNYCWSNLKYCNDYTGNSFSKYVTKDKYGHVDNRKVLDLSDDAARANWGGVWRMPTNEEWTELIDNCTWTWTKQNNVRGYKVTSKKSGYTDKSIFLPAAGYRSSKLDDVRSRGCYWSSSSNVLYPYSDFGLNFSSKGVFISNLRYRYLGQSIRPVQGDVY